MKAIVVTYQNEINYGAVLQAYALQKFLCSIGVENEYLNVKSNTGYFNKYSPKKNEKIVKRIFDFVKVLIRNLIALVYITKTKRKIKKFKEFVKEKISNSQLYRSEENVCKNPPAADVYITGSDQMFNAYNGVNRVRFLDFGEKSIRRISYATSMGNFEVPAEHMDKFIELLNRYYCLSLREKSASDYISKRCTVSTTTNIDPVFLLSKAEWGGLIDTCPKINDGKYILVYELLTHPKINDALSVLKKMTGLKVIVIAPKALCLITGGDKVIRDAGPLDFLQLFYNAEYVLTSSFHGTCFSILFNKKFYSFCNPNTEIRISSLLENLKIRDRIIDKDVHITCNEIEYDEAMTIITAEKLRAKDYLLRAVGL